MKREKEEGEHHKGKVSISMMKNYWFAAAAVLILFVVFCAALFSTRTETLVGRPGDPAAQQAAFVPCPVPGRGTGMGLNRMNNGFRQAAAVVAPPIFIAATTRQVPHGYRGVCSNCHVIAGLL